MSENNSSSGEADIYVLGSILAMIISMAENHSVVWAILHSLCSWFYVIYALIEKDGITLF